MPPKGKSDPKSAVLQLMKEKNRPYSVINIGDELHGEYPKSAIQKAVDALTAEGKITCKLFGKSTKIYFASQDGLPVASKEELEQLDAHLDELRERENELRQKVEELRVLRNRLANTKPLPELCQYRDELRQQAEQEETRRDALIKEAEGITPEDAEKHQKNFRTRCEQWRARKNKCREILDAFCEAVDKKPSELTEEVGLETDEACGLKLEFKDKKFTVIGG